MIEHFFTCPYCWTEISMLLDPSISDQNYVEDCENCCNPIEVTVQFKDMELVAFSCKQLEE